MKKALFIFALLSAGFCTNAQMDTLFLGDRDPKYYYWDTNWWDHYALNYTDKNYTWYSETMFFYRCKPEYARYCYIDTSLRVIGKTITILLYTPSRTTTKEN